jgi:hypothetical protein
MDEKLSCLEEQGHFKAEMVRLSRQYHALVVIRETITARAIRTPQRHLSHTTCRQVAAHPRLPSPAPVVETARPFRGRMIPPVLGARTKGCAGSPNLGVGLEGRHAAAIREAGQSADDVDDAVSGEPRSFSPMFGNGRRDRVQYWRERSPQISNNRRSPELSDALSKPVH